MAPLLLAHILCHLLIILISPLHFAVAHAYKNISLGSSLYANDDNPPWTSPSGDFAFGFRYLQGEDKFLLAIWFAKIPDKTIVWSANGKYLTDRESKLELSINGELVLTSPVGWVLWKTDNTKTIKAMNGAMLDTGNFMITSRDSADSIWESFKFPTNTILPTQVLGVGNDLTSNRVEKDYSTGNFNLQLSPDGNLTLNQIDRFTGHRYEAYYSIGSNISQVVFDESLFNLNPGSLATAERDFYFRATLDFDGTFTLYSHPRSSYVSNESWSIVQVIPNNICLLMFGYLGGGPCGFNSFCELGNNGKPICGCPPGFSLLYADNKYGGCRPESTYYIAECNQERLPVEENQFDIIKVEGADWPLAAYEELSPSTEYECIKFCLRDCYCVVAIFLDQNKSSSGGGRCWKKRLPLSNGRLNKSSIDRRALFKIFKGNTPSQDKQIDPNSGEEKKNKAVLILAVILGISVVFNFFSAAAISVAFFFFFHRILHDFWRAPSASNHLEMNIRSFTYKDLEESTNGFNEELGKGAFGTVYKGELVSRSGNYVAVKKLDKMVKDGEKEFKTEVKVIGQTHHKNLVQLLGYCDEGEHRLLVYKFMQNGSLSSYLFGIIRPCWEQRMQIAFGIARGLRYLHEECSTQIIHCDIKPQNILLDDSFTAKISDFGLAKLLLNNYTRTQTGIRGTKGYVAPEWFRNTPVSVKVDTYSFGIVLLEIICCRKCVEFEMEKAVLLADWAYECYRKRSVKELVEDDEEARSDLKRLEKLVMVAIWCVQDEPALRPSMRTVSLMLEGILEVSPPPCPYLFSSIS